MEDPRNRRKPTFRAGQVPGQWVIGSGKPAEKSGQPPRPGDSSARRVPGVPRMFGQVGKLARAGEPAGHPMAPEEEPGPPPRGFFYRLPGAFWYPFVRRGKMSLIAGGIVLAVLDVLRTYSVPLVAPLVLIFTGVYLCAYVLKVITASAGGVDDPPEWPAFANAWDDIVLPIIRTLATTLICFLPGVACVVAHYVTGLPFPFQAPGWKTNAIWFACWGFGLFYLPMSLLAVALFDSLVAMNPLVILRAIFRTFGGHLVACIMLALTVGVWFIFDRYVNPRIRIPHLASGLYGLALLYVLLVELRIIGLIYCANERRLGWFVVRG